MAAARPAGHAVTVPFRPGRTDATQEQTDVLSVGHLEPLADGFRNYVQAEGSGAGRAPAARPCVHAAACPRPQMTVLLGGLRAIGANVDGSTTACSPSVRAR
jgi:catalase-peroxidase